MCSSARGLSCIAFCFALLCGPDLFAATYYVDAASGSDRNKGTSPQKAWKSLDRVNAAVFGPGDSILLKRGATFPGALAPKGSGAEGRPIVLGAYGEGPRPVITAPADGSKPAAISLFNQEYWTLRDLETVGGNPRGISVSGNVKDGLIRGIRVLGCYVHDVGGESKLESEKDTGCIILSTGSSPNTQFQDAAIEDCEAAHTKRWAGIMIFGAYGRTGRSERVAIRRSVARDTYGDGIVMFECRDGVIEDCVAHDLGNDPVKDVGTPNGIWCWSSERVTIRRCEAYRIHSPDIDGGGFDIDYSSKDCVIEYCYAHDNDSYGVSVFGAADDFLKAPELAVTRGAVIRYNLFANNCRAKGKTTKGDFYFGTWNKGAIAGLEVYNNVSFWNPAEEAFSLAAAGVAFEPGSRNLFMNNVIYSTVRSLAQAPEAGLELDGNCYYYAGSGLPVWKVGEKSYGSFALYQRATGQDGESMVEDPMLAEPSYHGEGAKSSAYALLAGSPCLGAALPLPGREAPAGPAASIGAYQGAGVAGSPVEVPVASLGLEKDSLFLKSGGTASLRPVFSPDGATNRRVSWRSEDESVAGVSVNGTVTGRRSGKTRVSAESEDGAKLASCEIEVAVVTRVEDELADFSKVLSYSSGWYSDGKDPDKWQNGDATRICPFFGIGTDQSLVYQLDGMGDFEVLVGYCVADVVHDPSKYRFSAQVSPDGATWADVAVKAKVDDNKKWLLTTIAPASSLPAGTSYLKLKFYDNEKGWTTELSKVTLVARTDPGFAAR